MHYKFQSLNILYFQALSPKKSKILVQSVQIGHRTIAMIGHKRPLVFIVRKRINPDRTCIGRTRVRAVRTQIGHPHIFRPQWNAFNSC